MEQSCSGRLTTAHQRQGIKPEPVYKLIGSTNETWNNGLNKIERKQITTTTDTISLCRVLLRLGAVLWENNIPLIVCNSFGMIGYLRVIIKQNAGK